MEHPVPFHFADAEAIVEFAEETGAEVLCGALRYPSESGGWQLGHIDFSEHLAKYRDHEAMIVVASIGRVGAGAKLALLRCVPAGQTARCH